MAKKVARRERYSQGDKHFGELVYFTDGSIAYLAHRTGMSSKGLFVKTDSWCFNNSTLSYMNRLGVTTIGVIHRVGKATCLYATNLSDYIGGNSMVHMDNKLEESQRALPRLYWLVSANRTAGHILKASKL